VVAVELFWGEKPSVGSEIRFLEMLEAYLEDSSTSAIVLANFFAGRPQRQIDFLVITDVHVCHVELKAYADRLVGGTNGPWSAWRHDGVREPIDRENPYQQARNCKFALSDAMHSFAAREGHTPTGRKFYTHLDSVVCIFPRLAEGSDVPDDDRVRTLGYTDLVNFLRTPGNRPAWSRDRWLEFVRALGLVKGGVEGERAIGTSIAARKVATYSRNFAEFYGADLHELVPLPLTLDQAAVAPAGFLDLLSETDRVQLVGPSGAGKSHLTRHTALALVVQGAVPVLVAAGMYENRLTPRLNRVVGRFLPGSADNLLQSAKVLGKKVILLLDGLNECPLRLREQLFGDLAAFRLYADASILITTQEETPHGGTTVRTGRLAAMDKTALLESYGRPELLSLCEPFSTAYELSIASECAAELSEGTTRGTLMDAFVRKRLAGVTLPADVRGVLRRVAVAMNKRVVTWLPVDVVRRIAEQSVVEQEAPRRVIDDALGSSLTVDFQGRFSFSHELVGRFFVAEDLLLAHRSPAELAEQLKRPRHQDLPPLVVPLEPDGERLRSLVGSLGDAGLFIEALKGSQGRLAARVVRSMALDVLRKTTEDLIGTAFIVEPDYRLRVIGGCRLSQSDMALLSAVGAFTFHGDFLDEVVALLDATDAACRRSSEDAEREPTASYLVATVGLGFLDHDGDVEQVGEEGVLLGLGVSLTLGLAFILAELLRGFAVAGSGSIRSGRREVGDRRQGDRDVKQVHVTQTGDFEPLGEGSVVNGAEEHFQHPGEVGIVDDLAADERELVADSGRQGGEVAADALFDSFDQAGPGESLQHALRSSAQVDEVPMPVAGLLFGPEQLDQDLSLAPGELVERVAGGRQVDQPQRLGLLRLASDGPRPDPAEVALEFAGPEWGGHGGALQPLPDWTLVRVGAEGIRDVDLAGKRCTQCGDRRPRYVRKRARVGEIQGVGHGALAGVVRACQQREASGKLADDLSVRCRAEPAHGYLLQVHPALLKPAVRRHRSTTRGAGISALGRRRPVVNNCRSSEVLRRAAGFRGLLVSPQPGWIVPCASLSSGAEFAWRGAVPLRIVASTCL
jgi:nuclease-like protein